MKEIAAKNNITREIAGDDWVVAEAQRCLSCFEPPCQKACPASLPVPRFIRAIAGGNIEYAAALVRQANPLVAICGEVCPEEVFCQSSCTRGQIDGPIKIRELHRHATKSERLHASVGCASSGKVAVIGSGPAGISCAVMLAGQGIAVTVFEEDDHAGGVPNSSIPTFRLKAEIINLDIEHARRSGVQIILNKQIANPSELLAKFDAVFIAAGLADGKRLGIPGEDNPEVLSALGFLEAARAGKIRSLDKKRVAVIGGGNVSLDVSAVAAAHGAKEVHLLYRRSPLETKVWQTELAEAGKRGVIIDYLVAPIEFVIESSILKGIKCRRMELSDHIDKSGRKTPVAIAGSEFILPADIAIVAVGLISDYLRSLKTNSDLSTSHKGIFAGGDWARGEGTIVEAARDGKLAAGAILDYLKDSVQ